MHRYRMDTQLGDGSFGSVYRGVNLRSGDTVAIKVMKNPLASWGEALALREVASLTKLRHENIIRLRELVYVKEEGRLFFVFEFADANLYSYMTSRRALVASCGGGELPPALAPAVAKGPLLAGGFSEAEVRDITGQLLRSLAHMHKHGFFHRDVKPENILITVAGGDGATPPTSTEIASTPALLHDLPPGAAVTGAPAGGSSSPAAAGRGGSPTPGMGLLFKLADFGQARETRSRPPYTAYVSTRWYRAPEVVLGMTHYNSPVDVWAAGCVAAELLLGRPLFPGTSAMAQLYSIAGLLGPPTTAVWPDGARTAAAMGVRFGDGGGGVGGVGGGGGVASVTTPTALRGASPAFFATTSVPPALASALAAGGASEEAVAAIGAMLAWDPSARPSASEVLALPFFRPFMEMVEVRDKSLAAAAGATTAPPVAASPAAAPPPVLAPAVSAAAASIRPRGGIGLGRGGVSGGVSREDVEGGGGVGGGGGGGGAGEGWTEDAEGSGVAPSPVAVAGTGGGGGGGGGLGSSMRNLGQARVPPLRCSTAC